MGVLLRALKEARLNGEVTTREEERKHVHVYCAEGEAKFWLEPRISLAKNYGLSRAQLAELRRIVEEHKDEIADTWDRHFGS